MPNAQTLYNKTRCNILNGQTRNRERTKTRNLNNNKRKSFVRLVFRFFVFSCFRDYNLNFVLSRFRRCNLQFAICNLRFAIIFLCMFSMSAFVADNTRAVEAVPMDQVVALPVEGDPTVCFRLWFKVGSQNDPPGKEGLAALTAQMITEASTKSNSYEDVLDRLFPIAVSYAAVASVEQTVVYGRIHKDNLDRYYPLLLQAVMAAAFKQEGLDPLKRGAPNYLEKYPSLFQRRRVGQGRALQHDFPRHALRAFASGNDRRRKEHHGRGRARFLSQILHTRQRGYRTGRGISRAIIG